MKTGFFKKQLFHSFKLFQRLINPSSLLSLSRVAKISDIWVVLGITSFLGLVYGIFIDPYWSEAVDFGQAWAGLVRYDKSPWGPVIFSMPSLQILLPALLLLAGVKIWPLCLIVTGIFCAISFSGVAAVSFALSRNVIISILVPLLLLFYGFTNSYGYPVTYPVMYFQFGQTGQYLALLGFSLLVLEQPIAAGLVGGLLGGVHAVWCLAFIVAVLFYILFVKSSSRFGIKLLKPFFYTLTLSLILSAGLLYFSQQLLPARSEYKPPAVPQSALALKSSSIVENVAPEIKKKHRGLFEGHNVLLIDKDAYFLASIKFFFPEVVFFVLSAVFCFFHRQVGNVSSDRFLYGSKLLIILSIPVALASVFQVIQELDPQLYFFGYFDKRLPGLLLRLIINRWLNLTTILIPIMTVSLLFFLAVEKKFYLALLGLILILVCCVFVRHWTIIQEGFIGDCILVILMACFGGLYYLHSKKRGFQTGFSGPQFIAILGMSILLFFGFELIRFTIKAVVQHKFLGTDAMDQLVSVARQDNGPILIASGVISSNGFNPQLRTRRAIILPSPLDVYDAKSSKLVNVFCFDEKNVSFEKFYADIKPCFENRSIRDWGIISQETTATGIITPDSWKLKIKRAISGGGFSYYRLPQFNE